jgi:cytochrome P450
VEAVFRDPGSYSAAAEQAPLVPLVPEAQQILLAGGHKPQPSMVSLDEPAHARLRKPAARAFSIKRVTAMIPTIEAATTRLLDTVSTTTEFDLIATLAFPLPATIVFSLMGVPERDHGQLKQWCGYRAALGWGRPTPQDQVEIATNMAAYRKYLRDLVDVEVSQRGDDLTTDLIAIHREDPERLTLDEISSILFSLSFAGHETTTALIGNAVRRLLEDPSRWSEIAAHPGLIPPNAVEETCDTTRRCRRGGGLPPGRSGSPPWISPKAPNCSSGLPPRVGIQERSTSRMSSTCTVPTPNGISPSARACTIVWALTLAS